MPSPFAEALPYSAPQTLQDGGTDDPIGLLEESIESKKADGRIGVQFPHNGHPLRRGFVTGQLVWMCATGKDMHHTIHPQPSNSFLPSLETTNFR